MFQERRPRIRRGRWADLEVKKEEEEEKSTLLGSLAHFVLYQVL